MTARCRTLLSDTIRCACQQKLFLLSMLLFSTFSYFCCTQGTWMLPGLSSKKIFFRNLLLKNLLDTLFITTPWLLLTQATLQNNTITLPQLIKSSLRRFPKLWAVQVSLYLLLIALAFISFFFVATVCALLLIVTGRITVSSGVISLDFLIQLLTCKFWIVGVSLILTLLIGYFHCRTLFTPYLVIAKPQAGVWAVLRQSWSLSKPCLLHLLVATPLLNFFIFLPAYGLQLSALRTAPWAHIGVILCTHAIGLLAWIYFFVLYQQQTSKASLLPPRPKVDDASTLLS